MLSFHLFNYCLFHLQLQHKSGNKLCPSNVHFLSTTDLRTPPIFDCYVFVIAIVGVHLYIFKGVLNLEGAAARGQGCGGEVVVEPETRTTFLFSG